MHSKLLAAGSGLMIYLLNDTEIEITAFRVFIKNIFGFVWPGSYTYFTFKHKMFRV